MTQKFYFHDALYAGGGTMPGTGSPSVVDPTPTVDTNAGVEYTMNGTIGTAQVAATASMSGTVASNVLFRRFVSPPLAAQTLPAGPWSIGAATSEANTNANALFMGVVLYVWRPSTGANIGFIMDDPNLGTVEAALAETWVGFSTFTGTARTCIANDVLICETWADGTQTMAGPYNWVFYYDGTTESSSTSAASFLNAPPTSRWPPRPRPASRSSERTGSTSPRGTTIERA